MVDIATLEGAVVGTGHRSRADDRRPRHGGRVVRQRQAAATHTGSQPLRIWPRHGVDYEHILKYVATCASRYEQGPSPGSCGSGRSRVRPVGQTAGKYRYDRALCVDIAPLVDADQNAEMRKMRLLLGKPALDAGDAARGRIHCGSMRRDVASVPGHTYSQFFFSHGGNRGVRLARRGP